MAGEAERPSPLKRALGAISKLQARIDALEARRTSPVAITGLAGRLPGADGVDAFWTLLREGVDAVGEVPPSRWDLAEVYDPVPGTPGRTVTRWGAFLSGVDEFDADYFEIDSAEASRMDPQQRLLLESSAAALEAAGWIGGDGPDRRTGVYVGLHGIDYLQLQLADPATIDPHTGPGTYNSMAAGRLSYQLGLRGPCLVVDTACSSALVALHLAVRALRAGECDAAVVAGAHVTLSPLQSMIGSQMGNASPTGRIRSFDAAADGMVTGEGGGALVLRRLSDALRDRDPICAVVRGSALNQDGRSASLTSPNGRAQRDVILAALSDAGARADDVGYVEGHGSGTGLGDAIELEALAEVFGSRPPDRGPLFVGSVKTNVGHLQAAGGVAGLIRAVLALEHRAIPATLHFEKLNPKALIDPGALRIATRLRDWERPRGGRRVAGVSAFGFSGTNAHVVLEEAPEPAPQDDAAEGDRAAVVVPVTARSEPALRDLARSWAAALRDRAGARLDDVAYTASRRRRPRAHRAVVVAGSLPDLIHGLDELGAGRGAPVHAVPGATPRLVLQYPHRVASVTGAYRAVASQPAALEVLARCDELLIEHADRSILEALERGDDARLAAEPETWAPAALALYAGLSAFWTSVGLTPDAVWGDGVGEVAAALAAGRLELADAVRIAAAYGRVRRAGASSADARETFAKALAGPGRAGALPVLSTALGGAVESAELDAPHWVRVACGARDPRGAFAALRSDGPATVVVLSSERGAAFDPVPAPESDFRWPFVTGWSAARDPDARLLEGLGAVFGHGHPVDWSSLQSAGRAVPLPAHPYRRRRFWLPPGPRPLPRSAPAAAAEAQAEAKRNPLLGRGLESALDPAARFYETELGARRPSWVGQHRFGDVCWLPESTFVEMAFAAARDVYGARRPALRDLELTAPLAVALPERRTLQLALRATGDERFELAWLSREEGAVPASWTRHATARLELADGGELWRSQSLAPRRMFDVAAVKARCGEPVAGDEHYAAGRGGLERGPAFRGIERLWRGPAEVLVWILCPEQVALELPDYCYHPAALDACLQAAAAAVDPDPGRAYRLTSCDTWVAHEPYAAGLWSHATLLGSTDSGATLDLRVADSQGWLVLEARGLRLERVDPEQIRAAAGDDDADAEADALRAALRDGARAHRRDVLQAFLRRRTGELVGLRPEQVDLDRELPDLGLSSTNAVAFTKQLERGLGLELSPTVLWSHPALGDLCDFLIERLEAAAPPRAGAPAGGE